MLQQSKGYFITLEGGEGSGKTTLTKALYTQLLLLGCRVTLTRAPGGTSLGKHVRDILLHKQLKICPQAELLLFMADRAQHIQEVIQPALSQGHIVLCDRFNDSTRVYQAAARHMDPQYVEQMLTQVTDCVPVHLTIYLDVPVTVGLARASIKSKHDRIEQETVTFHETVRQEYLRLAHNHPQRIRCIDATLSQEVVMQEALKNIMECIQGHHL